MPHVFLIATNGTVNDFTSVNDQPIYNMAATSATQAEINKSKQRVDDGTRPIEYQKPPYTGKLKSLYVDPDYDLEKEDDTLMRLYNTPGCPTYKPKVKLLPRDPATISIYIAEKHAEYLDNNIQWADCPEELKPRIRQMMEDFWDVFDPEGLKYPI